MTYIMTLESTL